MCFCVYVCKQVCGYHERPQEVSRVSGVGGIGVKSHWHGCWELSVGPLMNSLKHPKKEKEPLLWVVSLLYKELTLFPGFVSSEYFNLINLEHHPAGVSFKEKVQCVPDLRRKCFRCQSTSQPAWDRKWVAEVPLRDMWLYTGPGVEKSKSQSEHCGWWTAMKDPSGSPQPPHSSHCVLYQWAKWSQMFL